MDIQLHVLDGYDATRQIKADPNTKATPIIAVNSARRGGARDVAEAMALPAVNANRHRRRV